MRRRTSLFIITLFLPVVFFTGLEYALHLFHYGGNLDLVVRRQSGSREFFMVNREVARRYFPSSSRTIPEPPEDQFTVTKGTRAIRIFCLGESTMAGFPFEFNATAPAFLESELRTIYPDYTIEVVNVGLSAVGTLVTLDLLSDLLDYQPDLFVIYVGHNEFYGVFGPSSSIGSSLSPWLAEVSIMLSRYRTFLALRDLVASFSSDDDAADNETLMEAIAGRQAIPYKSEIYEHTRRVYARNLELIIEKTREADVPVMFSALVSNIADQQPFLSLIDSTNSSDARQDIMRQIATGNRLLGEGLALEAGEVFRSAIARDSMNAAGWFGLGTAQRALRDSLNAFASLTRAKDLDGLRFRMSEEFQRDLREVCLRNDVSVAPADSFFANSSPLGLPGMNLFLEHLHPTIRGYALLARCWSTTIMADSLLPLPSRTPITIDDSPDAVTTLDSLIGAIRISYLTHRWPFQKNPAYAFVPASPLEHIALKYVQGSIPWQTARYEAASHFVQLHRFDLAREEATAVAAVISYSYEPILRTGDYYFMEGKADEAESAYRKCLEVEENPFAHAKLGLLQLQGDRFREAVVAFKNAFASEGKSPYRFTPEEAASNRYLLAFAYAKQLMKQDALRELNSALAINPGYPAARELLSQLKNDPGNP